MRYGVLVLIVVQVGTGIAFSQKAQVLQVHSESTLLVPEIERDRHVKESGLSSS